MTRNAARADGPEPHLSAAAAPVTRAQPFHYIPRLKQHVFTVNAGVERTVALDEAHVILCCVSDILNQADEDGLDISECMTLARDVDMALALYRAAGADR